MFLEEFNCILKGIECKYSLENINEIYCIYINRMVCIKSLGFYNVILEYSIYNFKVMLDNYYLIYKILGLKIKFVGWKVFFVIWKSGV